MPESLRTSILDVILREQEITGLIFPVSGLKEVDIYFFLVARRFPLHRTYDEELPEIPAGGTQDFDFLGSDGMGSGDDILRVWEQRPWRVYHYAIGIRPDEIWLYKQQPPGVEQMAFGYQTPVKVGNKHDYVPGYLSDYDNPTIATESVAYYKMTAYYGFKNDSSRPIRPSLRILGAGYDCVQITSESLINKLLAQEIPFRPLTVGGLSFFTYMVPNEWESPTRVSAEKISELLAPTAGAR